jgi:predicted O-linked N-acetylglucosamine transferase (SPINDLY family)
VGLPELITQTLSEYERKALELARHPEQLQVLRTKLAASRLNMPLFDTARFSRHLEAAYRTMHKRALRAEAPVGFAVGPLPE